MFHAQSLGAILAYLNLQERKIQTKLLAFSNASKTEDKLYMVISSKHCVDNLEQGAVPYFFRFSPRVPLLQLCSGLKMV